MFGWFMIHPSIGHPTSWTAILFIPLWETLYNSLFLRPVEPIFLNLPASSHSTHPAHPSEPLIHFHPLWWNYFFYHDQPLSIHFHSRLLFTFFLHFSPSILWTFLIPNWPYLSSFFNPLCFCAFLFLFVFNPTTPTSFKTPSVVFLSTPGSWHILCVNKHFYAVNSFLNLFCLMPLPPLCGAVYDSRPDVVSTDDTLTALGHVANFQWDVCLHFYFSPSILNSIYHFYNVYNYNLNWNTPHVD